MTDDKNSKHRLISDYAQQAEGLAYDIIAQTFERVMRTVRDSGPPFEEAIQPTPARPSHGNAIPSGGYPNRAGHALALYRKGHTTAMVAKEMGISEGNASSLRSRLRTRGLLKA